MTSKFRFKGKDDIVLGNRWQTVDPVDLAPFDDPEHYQVYDEDLVEAVNTAISLGMPLLLTGEPGVGKTSLASRVAAELNCECLMFRIKSTSEGKDAIYQIDHLGRMADANAGDSGGRPADILNYIHFNALGKAILRTWPDKLLTEHKLYDKIWPRSATASRFSNNFGEPSPSVVLIDEIDKAPSDVPNDLLEEIRKLSFELPYSGAALGELGVGGPSGDNSGSRIDNAGRQSVLNRLRPVVIITSNSERSLPQAFLRRCAFYHMTLPERPDDSVPKNDPSRIRHQKFQNALQQRLSRALGKDSVDDFPEKLITIGWDYFWQLRKANLERKPSTAELLNWMTRLCDESMQPELADSKEKRVSLACQLLVKQIDEVGKARDALQQLEH